MTARPLLFATLTLGALALAGCREETDLGKTCVLQKKDPTDPTGKRGIDLLESQIKPGRDYLSFGAKDCEDSMCVRDSSYQPPSSAPDAKATGYCSRACVKTSPVACPAQVASDDDDPVKKLTCRALVLDATALDAIRLTDPDTYKRFFGDTQSSYFCARGAAPDAGT